MSNGRGTGAPKGFTPKEVNSRDAFFPGTKFDAKFVQAQKKTCGIVVINETALNAALSGLNSMGGGTAGTSGFDLMSVPMNDTAILIDFGYVLMCNHSFKSIAQVMGNSGMKNGDVKVIFNNEVTAGTADTPNPAPETNRPFAKLRGDVFAWVGTGDDTCKEDFAIVRIEWNGNDFDKIGITAHMEDPAKSKAASLNGKKLCTFLQYSSNRSVRSNSKTYFSTQVAMAAVTAVDEAPITRECPSGKQKIYTYIEHLSRSGSSGGGVFNEAGELVAILCGGGYLNGKTQTFILPLEYIYACKQVSHGTEAGQHLKNLYNSNKGRFP
jgi:hypothetical protein